VKQDVVSLPCLVAVKFVEETEARVRIGLVHEEGKLCPGSLTLVCGEDLDSGNEAVCQVAGNRVSGQGVVSAFLVCGREPRLFAAEAQRADGPVLQAEVLDRGAREP
jgi:hypothetical protein